MKHQWLTSRQPGKSLLNIAIKNAELLLKTFGPDKKRAFSGH